jgi:hypothetical protein
MSSDETISAVCAPANLAALIRYAALLFVEVAALGTPSVEISKAKFRVLMTAAASNTSTGVSAFLMSSTCMLYTLHRLAKELTKSRRCICRTVC